MFGEHYTVKFSCATAWNFLICIVQFDNLFGAVLARGEKLLEKLNENMNLDCCWF